MQGNASKRQFGSMLQDVDDNIRLCHRHAEEWRGKALEARDVSGKEECLATERRWLDSARSYEVTAQIGRFLNAYF